MRFYLLRDKLEPRDHRRPNEDIAVGAKHLHIANYVTSVAGARFQALSEYICWRSAPWRPIQLQTQQIRTYRIYKHTNARNCIAKR